jgi:hypothetical protein
MSPYRNIANLQLLENFQIVRTETLRTYDFWKISKWSVPKHCDVAKSNSKEHGEIVCGFADANVTRS